MITLGSQKMMLPIWTLMHSLQRMTSQSQPAPPPSHVGPHSMGAEAHWQGVQRNEMKRGRRSHQAPSDQWADLSLRRLLPCHWASASGEEKKGVGERAFRPGSGRKGWSRGKGSI